MTWVVFIISYPARHFEDAKTIDSFWAEPDLLRHHFHSARAGKASLEPQARRACSQKLSIVFVSEIYPMKEKSV
jgi:hypothetical protein